MSANGYFRSFFPKGNIAEEELENDGWFHNKEGNINVVQPIGDLEMETAVIVIGKKISDNKQWLFSPAMGTPFYN